MQKTKQTPFSITNSPLLVCGMEALSLTLGILFSTIFLPVCFILVVSIRRSILDGSYIDNISSKYILVTGCDSGFGFELAKQLDSLGCHVIATCLTEEGMGRLKAVASSRLHTLWMDVTKIESVEVAEKRVKEILPSSNALWGIVNNAGIASFAPNFDFDNINSMKKVSSVNLWGTVAVTKVFLPYLKRSKGRIVNVCSVAGRLAFPILTSYSISKFGVTAFSDCIRLELSSFGISVHIIEPGSYKTSLAVNFVDKMSEFWNNAPDELRREYGEDWWENVVSHMRQRTQKVNNRVYEVINCMEHALLSCYPKRRYFPGCRSSFLMWWIALLPADIADHFVKKLGRHAAPIKRIPST